MSDDKKKIAFHDMREAAELLAAGRPPKQIKVVKKIPIPAKLRSLFAKMQSGPDASKTNQLLTGATKFAAAAGAASILNVIKGKTAGTVSTVQSVAGYAALGASIIEEMDALKLKRPLTEGFSINGAQAAKPLAQTTAIGILGSLVTGVPIASGLPPQFKVFKTLASLKKSPRFFDGTGNPSVNITTSEKYQLIGNSSNMLVSQCGLLTDEIMYRLVLLAENVYAPIREYVTQMQMPPLVILEGFRAENSRVSQHERGEAIDITLGNGTLEQGENLFNLAVWCRDNIIYDQLVLCFSEVGGGQAWIHISLTPSTNRRQVFTKPFNDTHVSGLFHYNRYTDETIKSQDQAIIDAQTALSLEMTSIISSRDVLLNPVGVNTPEQTAGIPVNNSTSSPGEPPKDVPDLTGFVAQAKSDLLASGSIPPDDGPSKTDCQVFEITKLAVARASGIYPEVGLLSKTSGKNCNGYAQEAITWKPQTNPTNICYEFTILIDSEGKAIPTWEFIGTRPAGDWLPPV